jgi:hypothetical protein
MRIGRRFAAAICVALSCASASVSTAQDLSSARSDVVNAPDFRVRVTAALLLGKAKPAGAREALVSALGDAHPAVRVAAAAALGSLGDPDAIPPMERRLSGESQGSVRTQLVASLEQLRRVKQATAGVSALDRARYVVQIGDMRNSTNVARPDVGDVMRSSAAARAQNIPGAVVTDGTDRALLERAGSKKVPVLLLDGSLTRLAQQQQGNNVSCQARVEFTVREVPQQVLRAALSGAATTFGSSQPVTQRVILELQNQAVDGAVESALRGAEAGLAQAARK